MTQVEEKTFAKIILHETLKLSVTLSRKFEKKKKIYEKTFQRENVGIKLNILLKNKTKFSGEPSLPIC